MKKITLGVDFFRRPADRVRSEKGLRHILCALAAINLDFLQDHPNTPPIYQSGVRYKAERFPKEEWQTIPQCLERGIGDCEDLACWRAAELLFQGVNAWPVAKGREIRDGFWLYHITVKTEDGSSEDPSALLGMNQNSLEYQGGLVQSVSPLRGYV